MVSRVLKMSASWCGPCKVYSRTFKQLSEIPEFENISFEEIDIEENNDLTEKYGVRSVPTTIILDENDNVLSMLNGNISKSVLEETIKEKM